MEDPVASMSIKKHCATPSRDASDDALMFVSSGTCPLQCNAAASAAERGPKCDGRSPSLRWALSASYRAQHRIVHKS
jgi:hypothetical protein